jgi:hypothetical protein
LKKQSFPKVEDQGRRMVQHAEARI